MAKWMKGTLPKGPWHAFVLLVLGTLVAYQGASSFAGAAAKEPRDRLEAGLLKSIAAQGETTFWVLLREEADLAPAYGLSRDDDRGTFVHRTLREVADRSQARLFAFLDGQAARYQPFWIVNAIRVTGAEGLLLEIAAHPEVKAIYADKTYRIPPPRVGSPEPRINRAEWGIERIGAPRVWSQFNVRGENIVVANIDTGVQYNHPALERQYRGTLGGGNFDHNYNWFDPSNVCGNPSNVPCDNVGTGTHTMGTMVGDDGQPGLNQIGVAPNAKWIAAKGCETSSCSLGALLASGQWLLAPTDLAGNNPQPSLRPHVVNNSWGFPGGDTFYSAVVDAWVASGIFPVFSNGDSGPGCSTSVSPGDYAASYSAGAFDINNKIASFSSRGPSFFGVAKPSIAAPGVNVRSSIATDGYATLSGTSMAAPHVAGTVALLWSWSTMVRRDIATTRFVVNKSAKNVLDTSCGGNIDKNNVWGDGRLSAFNALRSFPLP